MESGLRREASVSGLDGEVHFALDHLLDGVDLLEDLGDHVHQLVRRQVGALALELLQQLRRRHRLARQVAPHRLLIDAILIAATHM